MTACSVIWRTLRSFYSDTLDEDNLLNQCQVEMEAYLADKGLLLSQDYKKEYYDPLQWWKENKKKYPVVAALAQIFLFIPTSLAPSEQIWSRTSQVLSSKRGYSIWYGICKKSR